MPARKPHIAVASLPRPPAGVVVGVIAGPDRPARGIPQALPQWRRLTPLATWAHLILRSGDRAEILAAVDATLDRHGVPAQQLILLGEGMAARSVLELVLRGALACGGLLAIGVPCDALSFPVAPTAAAIRLVVSPQSRAAPDALIDALRTADIDERIIKLNPAGGNDGLIAASAAETFVLELVATVGHQARHGVRTDEKQKT
jgi:hypothetical protein